MEVSAGGGGGGRRRGAIQTVQLCNNEHTWEFCCVRKDMTKALFEFYKHRNALV